MKTEAIEFDTMKDVNQIVNILRSQKGQIEKLEDDPFAGADGSIQPVVAVILYGKASLGDAFKHFGAGKSEWGVQIYVYDLGTKRHIELIALGESAMKSAFSAYRATGGGAGYGSLANQYFNIRHSRDHRDQIAQLLA